LPVWEAGGAAEGRRSVRVWPGGKKPCPGARGRGLRGGAGISAALAAPAAAGIPVTHRGLSGSVTVVNATTPTSTTGQRWPRQRTLVFLMQWNLEEIVDRLLAHGARPTSRRRRAVGDDARQRFLSAPLSGIAGDARRRPGTPAVWWSAARRAERPAVARRGQRQSRRGGLRAQH